LAGKFKFITKKEESVSATHAIKCRYTKRNRVGLKRGVGASPGSNWVGISGGRGGSMGGC